MITYVNPVLTAVTHYHDCTQYPSLNHFKKICSTTHNRNWKAIHWHSDKVALFLMWLTGICVLVCLITIITIRN